MLNSTQYWYLQDHALFKTLNSADLKEICFISKYKTAKKGDIIFFSEENDGRVFTLKHGSLKIVRVDKDGNEVVKDILKKGDMFGQLSLETSITDDTDYAIVLSDSVVFCSFKSDDFEKFMESNPNVALKYTKWMGLWFKRLENRYANIMFKDVRTRLLHFLNDMVTDIPADDDGYSTLPNYLTHNDIASLICSTRQTVTALLNAFRTEGILEYSRKEIKLQKAKLKLTLD